MSGRILAADHGGAYALKLVGDVRVNLCSAIEDYLDQMFEDSRFESVVVDLCDAEGIDSTTLGILAKLALRAKKQYGFKPVIYSRDVGINRLLQSMAFARIFEIREQTCEQPDSVTEVPVLSEDVVAVKEKVIEAHRILMDLSDENRERFTDLMTILEQS